MIHADLLRIDGPHGQGDLFLTEFLKLIDADQSQYHPTKLARIIREAPTIHIHASLRRVDITLDFGDAGIGIENKPWAAEQPHQLLDYHTHLSNKYRNNYLLIYLSGTGATPQSLRYAMQQALATQRKLLVLSYQEHLQHWLTSCYKECHAEKVRWFLRDFIDFVVRGFAVLDLEHGG